MVNTKKTSIETLLKTVINTISSAAEGARDAQNEPPKQNGDSSRMDPGAARMLIASLASWAGKGKDEVMQILFREVGQAIAAMLKEPLNNVLENRKLQVTLELVPRKDANKEDSKGKKKPQAKSRRS